MSDALLVAELAVGLEAFRDDALQFGGLLDAEPDGRHRTRSRRHLIEHKTQRPEVGAVIDHLAASLFGRHVCRRPEDHAALRRGGAQRR